jgi:hypothetical protein
MQNRRNNHHAAIPLKIQDFRTIIMSKAVMIILMLVVIAVGEFLPPNNNLLPHKSIDHLICKTD